MRHSLSLPPSLSLSLLLPLPFSLPLSVCSFVLCEEVYEEFVGLNTRCCSGLQGLGSYCNTVSIPSGHKMHSRVPTQLVQCWTWQSRSLYSSFHSLSINQNPFCPYVVQLGRYAYSRSSLSKHSTSVLHNTTEPLTTITCMIHYFYITDILFVMYGNFACTRSGGIG